MTVPARFARWRPLLLVASVGLVACQSPARPAPEVDRLAAAATRDTAAIDACWRAVLASPEHRALRDRMGDHADSPSAVQRASRDRATPDEVALLTALQRDHVEPCRRLALASAAAVHPSIVAILRDSYAQSDAIAARLKNGTITWGEYVSESQAVVTNRRAELLAAGETLQRAAARSPAAR